MSYFPPDKPIDRPPSRAMVDLLERIVRTNGGGVSAYGQHHKTVQGLVDRHLIQGKAGQAWRMVHTPIGLDFIRKRKAGR